MRWRRNCPPALTGPTVSGSVIWNRAERATSVTSRSESLGSRIHVIRDATEHRGDLARGGALGVAAATQGGVDHEARQSLGHGLYLCTEFAVGNVAPGMFFGVGYSPLYQKKRDRNPVADRWELEAGFPFFVYAGYRLRKNVSVGLTAESYHKQMKWEGTKLPTGFSLWALEARFYFLQLGGFALYSATGGGMARLDPENRDTSITWFWDNTLLGVRQRIHGRVYALGELKSGSLAFGGRLGVGIRI